MKSNLLGRLKNALKDDSSDEELVAETIVIEDTGPKKTIGTSDILHNSHEVKGRIPLNGKVYVLELKPFLDVVGVSKGSKLPALLHSFSRNALERHVGAKGAISPQGDDLFFFRFSGKSDQEGWAKAVEIVNEIGSYFLRDAYKPEEFLADIIGAVDPEDAFGPDGALDIDNIRSVAAGQKTGRKGGGDDGESGDPEWEAFGGKDAEAPIHEWEADNGGHRPASARVKRQGERRKKEFVPPAGKERRKEQHGRRESDDPNQSVW